MLGVAAFALYGNAIDNAGRTAQNLATLMESQIRDTVQKQDMVLRDLQFRLDERTGRGLPGKDEGLTADLKRMLQTVPEAQSLCIIDRNGYPAYYAGKTLPSDAKAISISDRAYFQANRDDASGGLVISRPIFSRFTNNWVITLSRRLADRDGNFTGLIRLALSASQLTGNFARLDIGAHGVLSLVNDQREIIARYPGGEALSGQIDPTPEVEAALRGEGGLPQKVVSAIDGRKRITVYRRLPDLPFVVQAALSYDDVMRTWWIELCLLIGSTMLVAGALMAVLLFWQRSYGRAVRLGERRVGDLMTYQRAILENAPVGLAIFSLERICVEANGAFSRIFGYANGELNNFLARRLYPTEEAFRAVGERSLSIVLAGGTYSDDIQMVHRDGRTIWVRQIARIIDRDRPEMGVIWSVDDITEKRRTDQRLRVAATVFEAQEGMLVTDADGVILRVNRAFTEITRYSAEEAIGRKPSLMRSGRHDDAFYRAMWTALIETGYWEGEVWNRRKTGEIYPEWLTISAVKNANGAVTNYVGTLTDITQRKSADDTIRHLAFYDSLTGLPNRQLLLERLHQAQANSGRHDRRGALLFIDLDNFKTLNDTEGHIVGDMLLKLVGGRLTSCVRECDTVARFGGDEFVVILEDLSADPEVAAQQVERIGEKILSELSAVFDLGEKNFRTSSSIGVTLFRDKESSIDELLKQADLAMYRAKSAGRGTLRFFDPDMQESVSARACLESDLRESIEQGLFQVFYQPQVDGSGCITGAEALLRWNHPSRGLVGPDDFIPIAEETGMILPLGRWVLATACSQLVTWAGNPASADLTLAVNVSARQFAQPDFVREVSDIIERSGADARKLKLELTESLLVRQLDDVVEKMQALKRMGVHLSLDDFGTGYSSLSYLMGLPLDQMKIDKSFVGDLLDNPKKAAVVRTILTLARNLNLDVIAEGVETKAQHAFLARESCVAFQGYLFGRPQPLHLFEQVVASASPPSTAA